MQGVPVAVSGNEVLRMFRIGLDLLSQSCNRAVDGPHRSCRDRSPYLVDQLIPMHRPVGAFGEKLQDLELSIRERNGSRRTNRAASNKVNRDPPEADDVDQAASSPEHSADSSKQFRRIERFGDVIVGPQLESTKFVHL